MLVLRSTLFNVAFYANTVLWAILILPTLVLPQEAFIRVSQAWAGSCLWLLRVLAGTRIEVRHRERIPPGGLLIAAKHQSALETLALLTLFDNPAYILKRELMWIPFFGWYLWRAGMVPINRRAGSLALIAMNQRARDEAARGRQVIIFPEGTRRAPGAARAYKFGVAHLYANLDVPCLPVALNAGLFWPRRRFVRHPGTTVIEILDPIAPGLPRDAFFTEVQARIETASDRLLAEGQAQLGPAAKGTAPAGAPAPAPPSG